MSCSVSVEENQAERGGSSDPLPAPLHCFGLESQACLPLSVSLSLSLRLSVSDLASIPPSLFSLPSPSALSLFLLVSGVALCTKVFIRNHLLPSRGGPPAPEAPACDIKAGMKSR